MCSIDDAFRSLRRVRHRLPDPILRQAQARLHEISAGDRPRINPNDTTGARLADRLVLAIQNAKGPIHETPSAFR